MTDTKLNLGCCCFKLPDFVNIDIDPQFEPDLCMDLAGLSEEFQAKSVDFIFAGHIFEHFEKDKSQDLMNQCFSILKPFRMMVVVVPDYSKCDSLHITRAEKIILAQGDHKMLFDSGRLRSMLKKAGFTNVTEINDLLEVPYLIVPDVLNPVPEKWQTAFLAYKIY